MKPQLKHLRLITNGYFINNTPDIKWKRMGRILGRADTVKNTIYLNPNHEPKSPWPIANGWSTYERRAKLKKLTIRERYFLTLLHEIGHFKIKSKSKDFKKMVAVHNKVKSWSIKEFKSQRNKIKDILALY